MDEKEIPEKLDRDFYDINKLNIDLNIDPADVYRNHKSKVIVVTEDKIRVCLLENFEKIEKKQSWIAPTGILITIIVTLCTCTFKSALGLDPSIWSNIFIFLLIINIIWLVWAIKIALNSVSIEDIITELKGEKK